MSHHVFLLFGQARAFLLRRWRTDDGDTVSLHVLPANMDAAGQHVELSFLQPLRMVSLPLGGPGEAADAADMRCTTLSHEIRLSYTVMANYNNKLREYTH